MKNEDIDYAIGLGSMSAPIWLPELNILLNTLIAIGGLILVGRRIYKSFKE